MSPEEEESDLEDIVSDYSVSSEAEGERSRRVKSREYQDYKETEREHSKKNIYEKFVSLTSFFRFEFDDTEEEHRNALNLLNYDIEPDQIVPSAIFATVVAGIAGIAVFVGMPDLPMVFRMAAALQPFGVFYYLIKYPALKARQKVVESSDDLIMAILYMVISMRASPSLERAVGFAARHLRGPISTDFKTILWRVDMRDKLTMKKALNDYVKVWRPYNKGFVESVNLMISSLAEANEEKRNEILSQSIDQFLDHTRDQMKDFAQVLQMPVMVLYGLGILLPILGTVLLPLIATFMGGEGILYYLIFFYNILLPIMIIFIMQNLLVSRPVSFSSRSGRIGEEYGGKIRFEVMGHELSLNMFFISIPLFLLLSVWPAIHYYELLASGAGMPVAPTTITLFREMMPVIAFAIAGGLHLVLGYNSVVKKQDEVESMEREFPQALFRIGNLLERGLPIELVVRKAAKESGRNLDISRLFDLISENMQNRGMTFKEAVFDSNYGALQDYPSKLIETVMEITLESTKKGTMLAAKALQHISKYLQDIQETQERLEELIGDTLSSLQFLGYILAPVIAGIAVGMGSVISISFSVIGGTINQTAGNATTGGASGVGAGSVGLLSIMNFKDIVPPGALQLVVGIYLLQLAAVVGTLYVRLEDGRNPARRNLMVGKMMMTSLIFYSLTVLVIVLVFGSMIRGVVA